MAKALSPAKVKEVRLYESTGTAEVIVPDFQLSLAIGKEGQNARLAHRLTGWRIDIKSETSWLRKLRLLLPTRQKSGHRANGSPTKKASSSGSLLMAHGL